MGLSPKGFNKKETMTQYYKKTCHYIPGSLNQSIKQIYTNYFYKLNSKERFHLGDISGMKTQIRT